MHGSPTIRGSARRSRQPSAHLIAALVASSYGARAARPSFRGLAVELAEFP
jgi:hypothetical protein